MKLIDKYQKLKDKAFLSEVLARNVFATMALENQKVPMVEIEKLVASAIAEKELKNPQFFSDKKL
ncbi:hypothetical protein CHU92_03495 [Flavobacterium cyanobacteriorum]|uniref:Uncharacterized protein n=1 Tax=Flavobacterium cyanobacteriorum TaxID=2022802 RepID=A0A255ZPJ9_9FLAO|nr:hypothetical protein [Flavobacterium cyanobacteriorum]OYQ43341.1 hypothetical protein CHU92_03495 [Flavobacterium cyanobacteriorum]